VTIVGPSGTGKTNMAHGIHEISSRRTGPLVVENVGAMPKSLVASELFGHERGAFSGAVSHRAGLLRSAHDGTFVVDELTKAPRTVQHALLNVLEMRPFRPVGRDRSLQVNARIVALTSTPLEVAVKEGKLIPDLYERLRTTVVRVPPLDSRRDDVLPVAETALRRLHQGYGYARLPVFTSELEHHLTTSDWPGNHRHVVGVVARLLANADGAAELTPGHLPTFDEVDSQASIRGRFFADHARGANAARLGPSHASRYYGVDRATIRRWLRTISAEESGVA
jgi:DNA-binding NtrC family response regulator